MPAPDPYQRTQEQSIKARKHQLYETDEIQTQSGPRRTFAECLRTTPAAPLTPAVRAILWVVGTLTVLLLLAAFTRIATHHKPRPRRLAVQFPVARDFGPRPIRLTHPDRRRDLLSWADSC